MQQALDAGAKVAIIAGTCSTPEEKIADAALEKLGVDAADRRAPVHTARATCGGQGLMEGYHLAAIMSPISLTG